MVVCSLDLMKGIPVIDGHRRWSLRLSHTCSPLLVSCPITRHYKEIFRCCRANCIAVKHKTDLLDPANPFSYIMEFSSINYLENS